MAQLEKIAEALNVKLDDNISLATTTPLGKKRRPWLQDASPELGDKLGNKLGYRIGDLDNQLGYLGDKLGDSGNRLDNRSDNKIDIKLGDTLDDETISFLLSSLTKIKEKMFKYFLHTCIKNGSCDTGKILSSKMANNINSSYFTFKTTLLRLVKTKLIRRNPGKTSQTGYIDIHIYKNVKDLAILYYGNEFYDDLGNKLGDKLGGNHLPSSSNYINNTTTTRNDNNDILCKASSEWQNIDIEPLVVIGFTKTHLAQIVSQNKLEPKIVQDSIYAFAFDLRENNKAKSIKGDPINFFMGIVRNGKPYTPPSNYESPQDKVMREYLERMREIEKSRAVMEKEAFDLAFSDWFRKLSDHQKRELLPEMLRRNANLEKNKMLEGSARSYFEKEIWTNRKNEIIKK